VALAPDVDETFYDHAVVQLGTGSSVGFFGAQARVRVLRRARNVPVACHDHAAVSAQLAAEIHDALLKAALELVTVARDASALLVIRLGGAVDRIDIDDREPS